MKRLALLIVCCCWSLHAADSVDVTFRYTISSFPGGLSVPGEFNNWNNTAAPMSYQGGSLWVRTIRLAVGGKPGGGVPGAWQYKFYYNGVGTWPNDPLNHHVNHADNDNSFLYLKDPTIYQFVPNNRTPTVTTSAPQISAFIYPKVGSVVDTSLLSMSIDGTTYSGIGLSYDSLTQQLRFTPPSPLGNGSHTAILTTGGSADTVTFLVQAGFVQITNRFPFATWKSSWMLYGLLQDTASSVMIVRNGVDTFTTAVTNKQFSFDAPLIEGENTFVAVADSAGIPKVSSPVNYTRKINHAPSARISLSETLSNLVLDASLSADPDSGQTATLSFLWSADSSNPEQIAGIDGAAAQVVNVSKPSSPGEYYLTLIVTDENGNKDTTRDFFTLRQDHTFEFSTFASNPDWARKARIYFMFPKAVSSAGTIPAAAQRLHSSRCGMPPARPGSTRSMRTRGSTFRASAPGSGSR